MDKATWQRKAEEQLGRPIERLDYTPLPEIRVPALCTSGPATSRGTVQAPGWTVAAAYAGSPESVARAIREDVDGGVEAIQVDVRPFRGARDLAQVLQAVDASRVPVALAHGAIGDAAGLVGVLQGLRRPPSEVRLDFGLDPFATLAADGLLQGSMDEHLAAGADLAAWTREHAPLCRVFAADDAVWHDRGADEAWSIALVIAQALAYLRGMEANGLPVEQATGQIELRQTLPGRFLLGIAKLRATRRIVARIAEIGQFEASWRQTVRPAWRERSLRDPSVNILRSTASTFAGIVGGADRILVTPHLGTEHARRLARNTQLILRDESHLGEVADPAGGSHALESLTDQLALRAWACLQQLEREGGLKKALVGGFVKATLKSCSEREDLLVRSRKRPLLGVSRFPDPTEEPPVAPREEERPTSVPGSLEPCATFAELLPHALSSHSTELTGARIGHGLVRAPTLPARRLAEPFERLRSRGEREERTVYLAALGPLREHNARTAFGSELLAAGGLQVATDDAANSPEAVVAHWESLGRPTVLLSMADSRFGTDGLATTRALRELGAHVWILGRCRDEDLRTTFDELGTSGWIAVGTDVHSALLQLWEHA